MLLKHLLLAFFLVFAAEIEKTDAEWRSLLGRERYNVMRRKATERAYSGAYLDEARAGIYSCAACDFPLFEAKDKYTLAGCGWALFTKPIASKSVVYQEDLSFAFKRYEVLCRKCESHLGHVFHDGPPPKHLRYTINSIALKWTEEK